MEFSVLWLFLHKIIMHLHISFFSIIIICIDNNKWLIQNLLCSKYSLSGSPRLCTTFRQSSRNVVDILESVVYSYVVRGANGGNAIADNLFEFLLNILTYNKYYMIETSFNRIMNRVSMMI